MAKHRSGRTPSSGATTTVPISSPSTTPSSSSSSATTANVILPRDIPRETEREGDTSRERSITGDSLFRKAAQKRQQVLTEIMNDVILPKLDQAAENGLLTFMLQFRESARDQPLSEDEEAQSPPQPAPQPQQQQQGQQEGNGGHVAESDTVTNEIYFKILRDFDGRRKLRHMLRDNGIHCKTMRWGEHGVKVVCGWNLGEAEGTSIAARGDMNRERTGDVDRREYLQRLAHYAPHRTRGRGRRRNVAEEQEVAESEEDVGGSQQESPYSD